MNVALKWKKDQLTVAQKSKEKQNNNLRKELAAEKYNEPRPHQENKVHIWQFVKY